MNAARRLTLTGLLSLCALACVLTLASAPALAVEGYVPGIVFGEPCSGNPCGNGQFSEPSGVAVNTSTGPAEGAGDVYVVDKGDDRLERFDSTGVYKGQFDGSGTFEANGTVQTGAAAPTGQISSPEEVAVDNSTNPLDPSAGDVYVEDSAHKVIDKFSATGEYISQITETPGGSPFGGLLGVAVDPSGDLWVYQEDANVDEFSDTGSPVPANSFNSGRGPHPGLAVDSSQSIYLIPGDEGVAKFEAGHEVVEFSGGATALAIDPSTNNLLVDKGSGIELYGPFGGPSYTALETFATPGLAESRGIAVGAGDTVYATQGTADNVETFDYVLLPGVDTATPTEVSETAATLHGTVNPEGEAITACRFEYGSTTAYGQSAPCEQSPAAIGSGTEPVVVSARLSGLPPTPVRHLRLAAANANGTKYGNDIAIEEPAIEGESFAKVGSTEATVSAHINAKGVPASYRVEYGTSEAYGASTPEVSIGAPQEAVAVTVQLSKLQPSAEYHFRFVATSAYGSNRGPDVTFTTPAAAGASVSSLPDRRVYERVSTSSGPGEVYAPTMTRFQEQDDHSEQLFQAAASGDAVVYMADPAVSGGNGNTGAGEGNDWLATRTSEGWQTSDISPVGSHDGVAYEAFSSDLSIGYLEDRQQPPLSADAPLGCQVLYSRTSSNGAYHALLTATKVARECGKPHYAGASADGSQILFQDEAPLTENAQETELPEGEHLEHRHSNTGGEVGESCEFSCNLYLSVGGRLRLVNVLPNGEADPNATFGGPADLGANGPELSNAISSDGSRIFWTDTRPGPDLNHIYVLEDGTSTVPVSGAGPANYWTATPDGRYAFYTEGGKLWRFDTDQGTRTELAGEGLGGENAGVQGVLGINDSGDDGAYLYFVATGVLAGNENGNRERPEAGANNLYLRHAGSTSFIATLSPTDDEIHSVSFSTQQQFGDWVPNLGNRTAKVTADGRHLLFESVRPLTGYDNVDVAQGERTLEAFVYAADTAGLACASCSPTGEAPQIQVYGEQGTLLPVSLSDTYARRWISEDGSRVFFVNFQPLLAQDTNGVEDVYEWEQEGTPSCPTSTPARRNGGCVFLLSGGESSDYSFFIDSSADGNDVFFTNRARLVPQDGDEKTDLYDARVDGYRPTSPSACTGTGCQGVPPAPPIFATPSSVTFNGVGNFEPPSKAAVKPKRKPKACRKGFTKKHGKCVRKAKQTKKRAGKAGKHAKKGKKQ